MKTQRYFSIVVTASVLIGLGVGYGANDSSLSQQAMRDLTAAMHRDAFAYAKYSLYAKQAGENGNAELAKLFEETANAERFEHFANEARLAGLAGTDIENLKEAMQNEVDEVGRHAGAPQDKALADLFEKIRHDELRHREAFNAALTKLQVKSTATK